MRRAQNDEEVAVQRSYTSQSTGQKATPFTGDFLIRTKNKNGDIMKQFMDTVLNKFTEDITDKIFLMIQNDHDLMAEYLDLLDKHKDNIDLKTLNSNIGKYIKESFSLDNLSESTEPKSTLIRTFTKHKIKKS